MNHAKFGRVLAAGTALALAVSISGCAGDSASESPGETESVKDLTVWAFSSQVTDGLEAGFSEAYPDYDLEVISIPIGDVKQRLVVAMQGGEGLPDIVQLPLRESGALFATGQFLDMSAELEPIRDNFPEGILVGNGDEINSFTMGPGNMGLWINKAALAKHDLAVPDDPTWNDIVELARSLKDASDGQQYLFIQPPGANGFNMYNAYFHSMGGNWWNESGEFDADIDLAVEALEFLVDLDKEGLVYRGVWTDPTFWDAIRTETVAGWAMNYGVGSTNLQKNVPEQSGQWQLVTWPRWSEDAEQVDGAFGGSLFAGLKGADNVQGAKDLIMWWLSDEGLQTQADTLGLVAYKPAEDVIDLDAPDPYFGGQPIIKDLGSVAYPDFYYFNWSETQAALTVAVDQAFSGALSPQEAIESAVAELEAL